MVRLSVDLECATVDGPCGNVKDGERYEEVGVWNSCKGVGYGE